MTTGTNDTAVIVPNLNGIDHIKECLHSLTNQSVSLTIVVVENNSTDGSAEFISTNYPDVILLRQPTNLGFAGGVNAGIRYAISGNFQYIALFNNDAIADKNWAKELRAVFDNYPHLGIVTGLLLNSSGKRIDSTGEFYSKWGLSFPRNRGTKVAKAPGAGMVFGATGGASLYKTALFKDIGLFDEDFFAYYEDADISFRAQLASWKVAYTPKAFAYHKQGATSSKIPGFTTYQTFKNLPLLFIKNVPRGLLFTVGFRFYFVYWLILLNAITKGSGTPALKGAWMSLVLGTKKLSERRDIQAKKRVSTDYIRNILWNDLPPDQTGMRKLRKILTGKA